MWGRWLVTLSACSLLAMSACSGADEEGETAYAEGNASLTHLAAPWTLPEVVPCTTATDVNLSNAIWGAWLSANSYTHLRILAPELERLGFGKEGDGAKWVGQFSLLQDARNRKDKIRASELEQALVRTAHLDRDLDFFSGGDVVWNGHGEPMFAKGATQVTFAKHRTLPVVFVAFRGTEADEVKDIATDAKFIRISREGLDPGASVHRGFKAALEQVYPLLLERLDLLPPGTAVFAAGHSLGGALAVDFGARLLEREEQLSRPYKLRGVYTFGAPRVGNQTYKEALEARARRHGVVLPRFQSGLDIVTNLPFEWLGYRHAGLPIHLQERFAIFSALRIPLGDKSSDHRMLKYYDRLARLYAKQDYELRGEGEYEKETRLAILNACDAPSVETRIDTGTDGAHDLDP